MFKGLSERLTQTFRDITGRGKLTEANIKDTLREVRMALLEADVALPVVKKFLVDIEEKALGQAVLNSLTPGQALVKIVNDEMTLLMGETCESLNLRTNPPAVILMAGLQGSGKTTTTAKLAKHLKEQEQKSVMVASADIYRPAAIDQLETLAGQVEVEFFPSQTDQDPVAIAKNAIATAAKQAIDVVIIDTAGRLHVDDNMMTEIKAVHQAITPIETLFVVDSMTGQDAANTAKAFNDALPLTGVILTKTDGDARGGAALSIRQITGKPIKFLGEGEKIDALAPFHPDRVASRILGMGDVLSLIEQAERKIDKDEAERVGKKLTSGKFDLEDFRNQLQQMKKMGGISSLMGMLPGVSSLPKEQLNQVNDKEVVKLEAIIDSMTRKERKFPQIIKGSRKRRIAAGSGTQVQDVNKLLKQFTQMQKMMKKMAKKGGMRKMMQSMQQMMGPGGGFPQM